MRADCDKFAISKGGVRAFWWGQEAPHLIELSDMQPGLQQIDYYLRARQIMHVASNHLPIDKERSNQVPSPDPKTSPSHSSPPLLPSFLKSQPKNPIMGRLVLSLDGDRLELHIIHLYGNLQLTLMSHVLLSAALVVLCMETKS